MSMVFTFKYPPAQYFNKKVRLLTDFPTKQHLIKSVGINQVVWVEFDQEFAGIPAEKFIKEIIFSQLNAAMVICGYNYRFGYKALGDWQLLKQLGLELGFGVKVIPPLNYQQTAISSTRIRKILEQGDVSLAAQLLGRYQSYFGCVVPGKKIGRQLGFPTANFQVDPQLVLPKSGVYLTWCYMADGSGYPSMTSIGSNPTVKGKQVSIESFILNFEGDLYGQIIELQFLQRLRSIKRFKSIEQLKAQLTYDQAHVLKLLPEYRLQGRRIVLK